MKKGKDVLEGEVMTCDLKQRYWKEIMEIIGKVKQKFSLKTMVGCHEVHSQWLLSLVRKI